MSVDYFRYPLANIHFFLKITIILNKKFTELFIIREFCMSLFRCYRCNKILLRKSIKSFALLSHYAQLCDEFYRFVKLYHLRITHTSGLGPNGVE